MNEQITLVTLNNSQLEIFINDQGQFCLSSGSKSESILKLNEYIRLLISVDKKSIKIYANGLLQLDVNIDNNQWMIKDQRIDLFREQKNTTDETTVRIECKSITYLNKATNTIDEKMKSSIYSLDYLVTPPSSIMASSLLIDTILPEQKKVDVLSKLSPLIDQEKLKDLINISQFDTDEFLVKQYLFIEMIYKHHRFIDEQMSSDKKWFYQSVRSFRY